MPLLILQKYAYGNRYSTDFFLISDGLSEKLCYMSFNTSYTGTINHTIKIPYACIDYDKTTVLYSNKI